MQNSNIYISVVRIYHSYEKKLFSKFHKQLLIFHLVTKILCARYFYILKRRILLQQKQEAEVIMYRDTSWNNITIHQPVRVMKKTNEESINIDLYCCSKITISRLDKIEPVTVGQIPRVISRYAFYFCWTMDQ